MRAINSLFGCLLACSLPAASQNVMTSSPYSMFGVGEITSGLSKATLSQAVRWSPALSIGANLSYVFGSIVRKESQEDMSVSRETRALDYTFRQYDCLHSGESRIAFRNAHEVRAGLCYLPDGFASGSYWRRVSYKGGVNLSTPYLSENKRSGIGLRISLGLGFPVLNGRVHVAAFHDRAQWEGSTFRRQVTGMTVTYTIHERFYQVKSD